MVNLNPGLESFGKSGKNPRFPVSPGPVRGQPTRYQWRTKIDSLTKARTIAGIIDQMKGSDIKLLEVSKKLKITDFFLIATVSSRRLALAIADEVNLVMKKEGLNKTTIEGKENGWWVLLDFGDVVMHIFQEEARAYYDLELLYADVPNHDWHLPGQEQAS